MELLRLYESTSPLRGHTPINMVRGIAQSVSEGSDFIGEASEEFSRICLGGRVFVSTLVFVFLPLGVSGGVVWGFCEGWGWSGFRGGGGQALGVKVVKEGKRRVKGRLGSRAEDASISVGFWSFVIKC
ncbi:hypothetical protein D9758_018121 [Tetrapyrgos nigripes]|uniref:Uncharacterized protein n=1 Tax=Tetrapyrgos nigripes TaxID=182062 RepID=A0A8H5BXD4_9AGAR|nr:hypothetical protein D9758_018121 [Tetrapyrgos nigripes]